MYEACDRLEFSKATEGVDILAELQIHLESVHRFTQLAHALESTGGIPPRTKRNEHDPLRRDAKIHAGRVLVTPGHAREDQLDRRPHALRVLHDLR